MIEAIFLTVLGVSLVYYFIKYTTELISRQPKILKDSELISFAKLHKSIFSEIANEYKQPDYTICFYETIYNIKNQYSEFSVTRKNRVYFRKEGLGL